MMAGMAGDLSIARTFIGRPTPLVEEAILVLDGKATLSAIGVKHKQLCAVEAHDDYALALWSRIRWQWIVGP